MDTSASVSLLQVIKATIKDTHSLAVLTCPSTDNSTSISHHTKIFKSMEKDDQVVIGGMLFCFQTCWLHVVELPEKQMSLYLQETAALFPHATVCCFSDLLETRHFSFWSLKSLPLDQKEPDVECGDDAISSLTIDLLSLGLSLSSLPKSDLKQAVDDLWDRYRALLPSSSLVSALAAQKSILSLQEFIHEFTGFLPLSLESELVWPAQKPLVLT